MLVMMRGVVRARFEPRRHTHIMGHSSSSVCCLSTNYIRHLNCSKWLTYQGFASTDDSLHVGAADTFCTVLRELQNCSGFKTEMGWARPVTPLVYNHFYPGFIPPQTRPLNYPVLQLYDVSLFAFCVFSCLDFKSSYRKPFAEKVKVTIDNKYHLAALGYTCNTS